MMPAVRGGGIISEEERSSLSVVALHAACSRFEKTASNPFSRTYYVVPLLLSEALLVYLLLRLLPCARKAPSTRWKSSGGGTWNDSAAPAAAAAARRA